MSSDPISFGKRISEKAIAAQFAPVALTPPGYPSLACRVTVPKSAARAAEANPPAVRKNQLSAVAGFLITPEVQLQIHATILEFEVLLADWLRLEVERRGGKVDTVQAAHDANGQVIHANTLGPGTFKGRFAARSNGPHVILLAGQRPAEAQAGLVETLGLAAASLELAAPLGQPLIESTATYHDPKARFKFVYPKSWVARTMAPPSASIDAVEVKIASRNETVAYLRVHSDTSMPGAADGQEKIKQQLLDQLKRAGIEVSNLKALAPFPEKPGLARFAGPAKLSKGAGRVAFALQSDKERWMAVLMVSPARQKNAQSWMRARRAFQMVCASLSTA
ncbi:MAG TPA: hypothetical protein VGO67_06000 [Verrucomicrobiae bacterium]|jgi:hypothetical protein